jgi:hypothetical protein
MPKEKTLQEETEENMREQECEERMKNSSSLER